MKRTLYLFTVACGLLNGWLLVFTADATDEQPIIEGQVFVATQGGQNIRLGLVNVLLYSTDQMNAFLLKEKTDILAHASRIHPALLVADKKRADAKQVWDDACKSYSAHMFDKTSLLYLNYKLQAQTEWEKTCGEDNKWNLLMKYLASASYCFDDLPNPTAMSKTDADGNFAIQVPSYGQWVVVALGGRRIGDAAELYHWCVTVNISSNVTRIILANNNWAGTSAPESQIRGYNPDEEAYISGERKPLMQAEESLSKENKEVRKAVPVEQGKK
jgi:hypothetical protein